MKPLADHTLSELVGAFSASIIEQEAAIEAGDARRGNRHARARSRVFDELARRGDDGRDALAVLLSSTVPSVRVTAAAFLLRYRHAEARGVLEDASRGQGLTALEAGEALKRWDEGVWGLDPDPTKLERGEPVR